MLSIGTVVDTVMEFVQPSDSVVVLHSALWPLWEAEVSPEELLDGLLKAIGPDRTLIMPTFTLDFARTGTFHWSDTPSKDMGVLPELFRQRAGVVRSRNPMTSWAALGPLQEEACRDVGDSVWGPGTPFYYMYENDARIIVLGIPLATSASVLHVAEEQAMAPYRYFKTFRGTADYGDGFGPVSARMYSRRLDLPTGYDFTPVSEALASKGKLVARPLGRGVCEAAGARDIVDTFRGLIEADPLVALAEREDYEAVVKKPLFCFASSANTEFLAAYFPREYREVVGRDCRVLSLPFDQYRQQVLDDESDLTVQSPDYVAFFEPVEHLLGELLVDPLAAPPSEEELTGAIQSRIDPFLEILRQARERLNGTLLVLSFHTLRGSPLRMADKRVPNGAVRSLEIANRLLRESVEGLSGAYVVDMEEMVARFGASNALPHKYWYMGRVPFSRDFSVHLSRKLIGVTLALEQKTVRMLVLDLDNTLWSGVAGEEGVAGVDLGPEYPGNVFRDFQRYLKALSRRGIVMALASKNTESLAREVIDGHPLMVLHSDDFAATRINWDTKDKSIRDICSNLGLGLASVCFIDDNPAERDWVRAVLPDVLVPELPADPAKWTEFLDGYPYLETLSLTTEDFKRVESYRAIARSEEERKSFASLEDFYRSLEMKLYLDPLSPENRPRVLQLIAKTNQFNTTTLRLSDADLEEVELRGSEVFAFGLQDRHMERETIGVLIVTPDRSSDPSAEIDLLLMSCRVLGRKVETGVLAWLTERLKGDGITSVSGNIVPTQRNQPVRGLYPDHGFRQKNGHTYEFDLTSATVEMPDWFSVHDSGASVVPEMVPSGETASS